MSDEQHAESETAVPEETEVTRRVETAPISAEDPHGTTPAGEGAELTKVRELVLRAHPDIVPELVRGSSVDELIASVAPARAAYQQVADRVRAGQDPAVAAGPGAADAGNPPTGAETSGGASPPHVPAGGASNAVNLADIPPAEKIARALAGRRT